MSTVRVVGAQSEIVSFGFRSAADRRQLKRFVTFRAPGFLVDGFDSRLRDFS